MAKQEPKTPADIAAALRDLSERMFIVGTAMDYFGGFDKYMVERGAEMVGAAAIPLGWADAIEAKIAGESK